MSECEIMDSEIKEDVVEPKSYIKWLDKYMNLIKESNIKSKIEGFQELEEHVRNIRNESTLEIFDEMYELLMENMEAERGKVRQGNYLLLKLFVEKLPISTARRIIDNFFPLIKRLVLVSRHEIYEEDCRFHLLQLLILMVDRYEDNLLEEIFDDLIEISLHSQGNEFSSVPEESCKLILPLWKKFPKLCYPKSEHICERVLSSFSNSQSTVRSIALRTILTVVMEGSDNCLKMAYEPIANLLKCSTPETRLEAIRIVGYWIIHHPDNYSILHLMILLIFNSFNDYSEINRKEAAKIWDEIGLQYMIENQEELADLIASDKVDHYPPVPRPNLGCRTIVQRNMHRILPLIMEKFENSECTIVCQAGQNLYFLMLNAESKNMQFGTTIYNCLCKGVRSDKFKVPEEFIKLVELFGYFVGPKVWWNLLISDLEDLPALDILNVLIKGADVEQMREKYLKRIFKELCQTRLLRNKKLSYQRKILTITETTITTFGIYCKSADQDIFNILFNIFASPLEPEMKGRARDLLEKFRQAIQLGSNINDLYDKYIRHILVNITSEICYWTRESHDENLFRAILEETGPVIGSYLHIITPILFEALCKRSETKLDLLTHLSIILLKRDENFKSTDPEKLYEFYHILIREIFIPIISSAGYGSDEVKAMVVCCLCALFQDTESSSEVHGQYKFDKCIVKLDLFPDDESLRPCIDDLFTKLTPCLQENLNKLKQFTLRALRSIIIFTKKRDYFTKSHFETCYKAIIPKLEDNNDQVRLHAVETLCTLFTHLPSDYNINDHIDNLYNTLLIHLEDPDPSFQDVVLDALKKLCDFEPKLLKEKVDLNIKVYRNTKALEHLDKHISKTLLI